MNLRPFALDQAADCLHPAATIAVIGTDAAGVEQVPAARQRLVRGADLVAAPARLLPGLQLWLGQSSTTIELLPSDDLPRLLERFEQALGRGERAVLLASGDPLWFGIGRQLLERFGAGALCFHPGPSSLQLAFARIGRPWHDAAWVSLHGRDPEPLAARLQLRPPALAVLTDPGRGGADSVRSILRASGLEGAYTVWLCERLGHREERVQRLEPSQPTPENLDPLHLVLLVADPLPPLTSQDQQSLPLFGLEDGLWLQHSDRPGLMTKREVRIQLLADLQLPATGVLWDLGAGVGSVGIEALRLRPALQLWAVEQRSGGSALIRANAARFGVAAALAAGGVIEARAPEVLARLPDPDRVLIGGGGQQRAAITSAVAERLRPGGVVVIPLATLEALAELRPLLQQHGLLVRVSQLQAWRGAPLAEGTRLAPLNPVLVLSGAKPAAG